VPLVALADPVVLVEAAAPDVRAARVLGRLLELRGPAAGELATLPRSVEPS
jgi:hypothetical protein